METTGKHATMAVEAQLVIAQLATLLQSPGPMQFTAALSILSSTLTLASPPAGSPAPAASLSVLPPSSGLRGWAAFLLMFSLLVSEPPCGGRTGGARGILRQFHQEIPG